jgi:hypothetical protein
MSLALHLLKAERVRAAEESAVRHQKFKVKENTQTPV